MLSSFPFLLTYLMFGSDRAWTCHAVWLVAGFSGHLELQRGLRACVTRVGVATNAETQFLSQVCSLTLTRHVRSFFVSLKKGFVCRVVH